MTRVNGFKRPQRKVVSLPRAFGDLRSDYNAVRDDRYTRVQTGFRNQGTGADYHYRVPTDFYRLIEIAREYRRNDPIIGKGVRRLTSNVIQCGFLPNPRTGSDELDEALSERWKMWAEDPLSCDISGTQTFAQMERSAFDAVITDGDIFAVRLDSGHLRWYEAHRAKTPTEQASRSRNVVHGVQMNGFRRPVQYWFTREDIDPNAQIEYISQMARVRAQDGSGVPKVMHLKMPDRITQTRGVTALAAVAPYVGMLDDLQFAKLVQAQAVSAYAVFKKRALEMTQVDNEADGPTDMDYALGFGREFELMGPGQIYEGQPGEDLQAFSPNVPNPEYFQHAMLILTVIAINLDLPVCVLLLDASQTNFSGFRGALDQARQRYREMQDDMVGQFHRPCYRWQVSRFLQDNDISRLVTADVDPYRCEWVTPKWPYIEPLTDTQADLLQLKGNLNSPRRIQAEQNRRWDLVSREIIEDNVLLIEQAMAEAERLGTAYPDQKIDWREIAALPLPEGMKMALTPEDAPEPQPGQNNGAGNTQRADGQ